MLSFSKFLVAIVSSVAVVANGSEAGNRALANAGVQTQIMKDRIAVRLVEKTEDLIAKGGQDGNTIFIAKAINDINSGYGQSTFGVSDKARLEQIIAGQNAVEAFLAKAIYSIINAGNGGKLGSSDKANLARIAGGQGVYAVLADAINRLSNGLVHGGWSGSFTAQERARLIKIQKTGNL